MDNHAISDGSGSEDVAEQTRKRKLTSDGGSSKQKSAKMVGIDGEAAESGEEDYGSDGSDEEDDRNYVADEFLVLDQNDSDNEDLLRSHQQKKSKSKIKSKLIKLVKNRNVQLDEDDLSLIQEHNVRNNELDDEDDDVPEDGDEVIAPIRLMADESDDRAIAKSADQRRRMFNNDIDENDSDLDDFIVPDEENGDDSLELQDIQTQQRQQRAAHNTQRRSGKREGPTYDQVQEAMDIFGAGYGDFDDEEEEEDEQAEEDGDRHVGGAENDQPANDAETTTEVTHKLSAKDKKLINKLRSRFERSQLVASFCTDQDEEIRRIDRPERFQEIMKGRDVPDDEERATEAQWVAGKLAQRMFDSPELRKDHRLPALVETLRSDLVAPVEFVLRSFQVDQLEAPFLWAYRKDYLHPLMTRGDLWHIGLLDEQWELMYVMKLRLKQLIMALSDAAVGSAEEDEQARQSAAKNIQLHTEHYNALLQEVIDAEQHQQNCMDLVDEREDHTDEDRENVIAATERLESLKLKLEPANADLLQIKEAAQLVHERILRKAHYSRAAAEEVMRLFPKERFLSTIEASNDEIELRDVFHFLTLLMQGADAIVEEEEGGGDGDAPQFVDGNGVGLKMKSRRRGIAKKDEYSRYKAVRGLRSFVEMVAVRACDFGDLLRHGIPADPPDTGALVCDEVALQFVDDKVLKSEQIVIKGASVLIATELSAEPSVRAAARAFFKDKCTVSSRPTERGLSAITPFSEYFGLHYVDRKPLREFYSGPDRTMFIRMAEAERLGLITLSIDPPSAVAAAAASSPEECKPDLGHLFMNLMLLFLPKAPGSNPARQTWDEMRITILQLCLEKHMLPAMQTEFRRDLLRVGREAIVEESAATFERLLKVGPHRTPNQDTREYVKDLLRSCPNRPNYSTVAAIFQPSGGNDPLCMAFVNRDGVLRAHDLLPKEAASQKMDRIKQFIVTNKPDLILLNASGGFASRSLSMHLEKNLLREVGEQLELQHRQRLEDRDKGGYNAHRDEDEDEFVPYKAHVMVVRDDLANIFKGSLRAKTMFPELQPCCAAAVSLARYAQEPLSEYCHLWTAANATDQFGFEALFLDLHPLKALLGGAKPALLRALECRLVDAVCDVGVDINKAILHDHLSPMLAFVAGLGLRKADALKQNVRRLLGVVENRNALLIKKLLGRTVWTNSSGFLRICDTGADKQLNPLDNTRIHPECYVSFDFAPKICADALEVDCSGPDYEEVVERLMKSVRRELEKRMKKHPKWVDLWENGVKPVPDVTPFHDKIRTQEGVEVALGIELHDSLQQLELDEFADDLEKGGNGKRRLQLEQIKDELRFPWLDLRPSVGPISANDSFAILTGETDSSLYVGLKIGCTVNEIADSSFFDATTNQHKRRQRAMVKTDSGLRGFVSIFDVSDDRLDPEHANLSDYLQPGMHVLAVVTGVRKDKMQVDLSVKPSHLRTTEAWWMENRETDRSAKEWWERVVGKDPARLFDRYFREKDALKLFAAAEESQSKKAEQVNAKFGNLKPFSAGGITGGSSNSAGNRMQMRTVHHPLFANLDFKATEDRLRMEGKGAGEVLIRPSSKGADFLTITWAFQENWFKHIGVQEKGKRAGDPGLGKQLFIQESDMAGEAFSDLDEIFSRYIEPMNDLVAVMVSHRNFQAGSVEEVEARMREELRERPSRIPYFIRFEPSRPGSFVLTWLSLNTQSEVPVKKELIEVRPYGYKIRSETFARPSDLISWFKKTTESAAAASRALAQQKVLATATQPPPMRTGNAYPAAPGLAVGGGEQRRPSRFSQIERPNVPQMTAVNNVHQQQHHMTQSLQGADHYRRSGGGYM